MQQLSLRCPLQGCLGARGAAALELWDARCPNGLQVWLGGQQAPFLLDLSQWCFLDLLICGADSCRLVSLFPAAPLLRGSSGWLERLLHSASQLQTGGYFPGSAHSFYHQYGHCGCMLSPRSQYPPGSPKHPRGDAWLRVPRSVQHLVSQRREDGEAKAVPLSTAAPEKGDAVSLL